MTPRVALLAAVAVLATAMALAAYASPLLVTAIYGQLRACL